MKTLKQLERLRKAHKLIKMGKTGTPAEFAKKLFISPRELYRVIEYLKEMDAIITYSRRSSTYYYNEDFELMVNVSVKVLINEQLRTVYAGPTDAKD
ncbi:DNA-binding protein [Flavobacteriaceae bacterium F08102]|nr:DNA-binding protein [Flavobacteriaceae bacterium F08102]